VLPLESSLRSTHITALCGERARNNHDSANKDASAMVSSIRLRVYVSAGRCSVQAMASQTWTPRMTGYVAVWTVVSGNAPFRSGFSHRVALGPPLPANVKGPIRKSRRGLELLEEARLSVLALIVMGQKAGRRPQKPVIIVFATTRFAKPARSALLSSRAGTTPGSRTRLQCRRRRPCSRAGQGLRSRYMSIDALDRLVITIDVDALLPLPLALHRPETGCKSRSLMAWHRLVFDMVSLAVALATADGDLVPRRPVPREGDPVRAPS